MNADTTNTVAAGRKIAIEMLREAYALLWDARNQTAIDASNRARGRPQDNYVAKHLAAVDGKPHAAAGLASVLSDLLASGGFPDVVCYEESDRRLRRRERRDASEGASHE